MQDGWLATIVSKIVNVDADDKTKMRAVIKKLVKEGANCY